MNRLQRTHLLVLDSCEAFGYVESDA
jgi:hypothetical protein